MSPAFDRAVAQRCRGIGIDPSLLEERAKEAEAKEAEAEEAEAKEAKLRLLDVRPDSYIAARETPRPSPFLSCLVCDHQPWATCMACRMTEAEQNAARKVHNELREEERAKTVMEEKRVKMTEEQQKTENR